MTPKRVSIFGESPLVEEYASLCFSKGLSVTIRLNGGSRPHGLPKEIKNVRTVPRATDVALELTNTVGTQKRKNLAELDKALAPAIPILSSSVSVTATNQAKWVSKPARLLGIGALPSLLGGSLIEFAPSPLTAETTVRGAQEFARDLGKETAVVHDQVGLVIPRILCMLANEAYFALDEELAHRNDIDHAMKLGANYPRGPLEWADKIGLRQIRAVLEALSRQLDSKRYRIAPLLDERAKKTGTNRSSRSPGKVKS